MRALVRLAPRVMGLRTLEGALRAGSFVAGVALATLVLLALLSVSGVVEARQARGDARQPVHGPGLLEMQRIEDSWRGVTVTRVLVASMADADPGPVPPGVSRLPAAGEAVVSPELGRLAREAPGAAGLLSGAEVTGFIDEDGLLAPDELFAYIGVDPAASMNRVSSFGGKEVPLAIEPVLLTPVLLLLGLLVWVPTLILVMVISSYGARLKEEQLRLLMLIGVRRSRLRVLAAVEAVILTVTGCAIGCAVAVVLLGHLGSLPGTRMSWFPTDVSVPWPRAAALAVAAVVSAGAVAFASGAPAQSASTRPALGSSKTRWASVGLLLAGAAGLALLAVATRWLTAAESFRALVVLLGTVMVGIPMGLPTLVQALARRWVSVPRGAASTLSARWLEYSPGSSSRVVAGVGAAVLTLSLSLPFVSLLSAESPAALDHIARAGGATVLVSGLDEAVDLQALSAIEGVSLAVPVVPLHRPHGASVPAVLASCTDLSVMSGASVHCPDAPTWLATSQSIGQVGRSGSAHGLIGGVTLPPDDDRLTVDVHPLLSGWLLVPTDAAQRPGELRLSEALVYTRDPARLDEIVAAIVAWSPHTEVDSGYLEWVSQSRRFATPVRVLTVGLAAGIAIAALAVLVAALSDGRERLRNVHVLAVLGARRKVTRRALAVAAAVPGVLGVSIAVVVGSLAAWLMGSWDSRAAVPPAAFVGIWLTALSVLGSVAVVAAHVVSCHRSTVGLSRRAE